MPWPRLDFRCKYRPWERRPKFLSRRRSCYSSMLSKTEACRSGIKSLSEASITRARVTSVNREGAIPAIRNVAVALERALTPLFTNKSYGGNVDQFTIVAIIYSDEPEENARWCGAYDKVSSFTNPLTKERVRSIGFAVPLNPARVDHVDEDEYRAIFCNALVARIKDRKGKIPKSFEYDRFVSDLSAALQILSVASFANDESQTAGYS